MKRLIRTLGILALAGVWLVCLAAASASAGRDRSGDCGENLAWAVDDDGVLTVSGTGEMYSYIEQEPGWIRLRIRKAVIEPGVTGVGALAFANCFSLETVEIPDSVTRIGDYAFDACNSLESVSLPDGVREIGANPFSGCGNLREILLAEDHPFFTVRDGMLIRREDGLLVCRFAGYGDTDCAVPEGVTAIGDDAFAGCARLRTVALPERVAEIGRRAFSGCESLTEFAVREGTVSVGAGAFSGCENLEVLSLPDSLETLGDRPFEGCGALREIRISPEHPYLSLTDGMLVTKADGRLVFFTAGNGIMRCAIPEGTRAIGGKAFENGGEIREIVMPRGVEEIGDGAFYGCRRVREITFAPGLKRVGREAFADMDALEEAVLPDGLAAVGDGAFAGCGRLRTVTVPESVTEIGKEIFGGTDTINLLVRVKGGSEAEAYCLRNGLKTAFPEQGYEDTEIRMPYAFTDTYPGYRALFELDTWGGENEEAYLARTPEGALVILCGTEREGAGWTVIESATLPAESTVVMNDGLQMLDIGNARCTVRRYHDDVWGIGFVGWKDVGFGPKWVGFLGGLDRTFGIHPWGDLTAIDWISLDDDWNELSKRIDESSLATPCREDRRERTPLYTAPDGSGEKVAGLVNGAPLFVQEQNGGWTRVRLGRGDCWQLEGWVRTEDLVFGKEANSVVLADPGYLMYGGGGGPVDWITPLGSEEIPVADYDEDACLAVGEKTDATGEYWLIYDCDADRTGFVPKEQLREPNG